MKGICSVSGLTFKEGLRERIFHGIFILFLFILFLNFLLSQMAYGEREKVLCDVGLAGIELTGIIILLYFLVNSFFREKETKMLEVYLVRFSRVSFIWGRFLGASLVAGVFLLLGLISLSVLLFLNNAFYFSLILGVYFIFLKLLIILAFGLLFSTFISSQTLAYLLSLFVYIAGSSAHNALEIVSHRGSKISQILFKYFYYLLPNLDRLEIKLMLTYGRLPPISYVLSATLYTLTYICFLLIVSLLVFQKRQW